MTHSVKRSYPPENFLYRLLFGLDAEKTRADLGFMPEVIEVKNQLDYFVIDPRDKAIDLDKIRAACVTLKEEIALACLVIYLGLQNNYGIATVSRTYLDFFFTLIKLSFLVNIFVKLCVAILLPGTVVTVLAAKALKVIYLPRDIYSWGQETLLKVTKESFSKVKKNGRLLVVMSASEYDEEIKENIDAKYGFIYTAYMDAKEKDLSLFFVIVKDESLSLNDVVQAMCAELGGSFSVLPYSVKYHEDVLSHALIDNQLLPCLYHPRRILSKHGPKTEYGTLFYEAAFSSYILFFNYFGTYVVSICQSYATTGAPLGINESSPFYDQVTVMSISIFIGVIRNWVTLHQKEEDAERSLRFVLDSFLVFLKTSAFRCEQRPSIVFDDLMGLLRTARYLCPRSYKELPVRLNQLYYIQLGLGGEAATYFTYFGNTFFFAASSLNVWTKVLFGEELSSTGLLTFSLLAAWSQASLNSTSQAPKVRIEKFKKAYNLEQEILRIRREDEEISIMGNAYTIEELPTRENCMRAFYDPQRTWSTFFLKFFVAEDAINTAFTAAAGLIKIIHLLAPSKFPEWVVVLFSLIPLVYMYASQTTFNVENIAKDMATYHCLFHCSLEGFWDQESGRYAIFAFFNQKITSCFFKAESKSEITPLLKDGAEIERASCC